MWQRLLFLVLSLSSISAQSFFYSYVDPCEQTVVRSNYTLNSEEQGFQVTYYNRTKFFTLEEVLAGELEQWTQSVYSDFQDLFPCAVKVAEEILSSVIAENVSEQFSKSEDISTDPQQVNYAIRSTQGEDRWITSFNSVYTATSFDGGKRHDGNFNFTDDLRKGSITYGQGFNLKAKKQNVVLNGSALTYKTFEGWDWLVSGSFAKSLQKKNAEARKLQSEVARLQAKQEHLQKSIDEKMGEYGLGVSELGFTPVSAEETIHLHKTVSLK